MRLISSVINFKSFIDQDTSNKFRKNYLDFYSTKTKHLSIFQIGEKFDEAVRTKFKIVYLKDYVFALETNDKLTMRLSQVSFEPRIFT